MNQENYQPNKKLIHCCVHFLAEILPINGVGELYRKILAVESNLCSGLLKYVKINVVQSDTVWHEHIGPCVTA